jgi:riboflavin synthase
LGSIAPRGAERQARPCRILGGVFTGLVQALGRVEAIRPAAPASSAAGGANATRLEIAAPDWSYRPDLGASVSVNGCCLTVVAAPSGALHFDVIPQTLAVTSLGSLRAGDGVNLEHAATPTTFLGGHVVLGHVDGLAEVVEVRTDGEWRVRLRLPGDLGIHAVDKGSIALDGVSLTIARVEDASEGRELGSVIDVCLIPETLARTNLAARKPGDRVNVEVDYLAKLVARQLEWMKKR